MERSWQSISEASDGSAFTYLVCGSVVNQTDAVNPFQEAAREASTRLDLFSGHFIPEPGLH